MKSDKFSIGKQSHFPCWRFRRIFLGISENDWFAIIFREILYVSPVSITFSHCAFPTFVIREPFLIFHQNDRLKKSLIAKLKISVISFVKQKIRFTMYYYLCFHCSIRIPMSIHNSLDILSQSLLCK